MRITRWHLAMSCATGVLACADTSTFDQHPAGAPEEPIEAVPDGLTTKLIRHAVSIPDEYIVVMNNPTTARTSQHHGPDLDANIDRLATAHHASVTQRYGAAFAGFSATMSEQDALALAEDPAVAYVEENALYQVSATTQTGAPWGLDRIDQISLPLDGSYTQLGQGEGATIFVIDSGVRGAHNEFVGRMKPGYAGVNDGALTGDCHGHGTHVAGIAAGSTFGVAKRASIVPVRVLDCAGVGANDVIIAGINWVIQNHGPMSVANMSVSGPASPALNEAARNAVAAGVTMVIAAGNENHDASLNSPASEPLAITVGATDVNDVRSTFSNYGTLVDLSAPGTDILSAGIASNTSTLVLSGTSMAAPHVAGVVAAYLATHPTTTPAQIQDLLTQKAIPGKITNPTGSPNLLLNASFIDTTPPLGTIRSPANNAEVPPDFTVSIEAADANLASVTLTVDSLLIGTKGAPPFEFEVSGLAAGRHQLTVVTTDLAALTSSSTSTVTVTSGDEDDGAGGGNNGSGGTMPDDGEPGPVVSAGCSAGGPPSGLLWVLAMLSAMLPRRRGRVRKLSIRPSVLG
ncbi:MAG: S8 family serine peptidase [Kofleriaceae bacterium]